VIKGRKMPGQTGNRNRTSENLRVERVIPERNLILLRGSVPGARNNTVFIRRS